MIAGTKQCKGMASDHIKGYYPVIRVGKEIIWEGSTGYRNREITTPRSVSALDVAKLVLGYVKGDNVLSLVGKMGDSKVKTGNGHIPLAEWAKTEAEKLAIKV